MAFTTLISTDALALHANDPAFVIVDCRYKLDDENWGEREYQAEHIPGAVYADLGRDLAGPRTGRNGRHPLPDPHTLAQTFGRFGITSGVQVVAYDQEIGMYASRLWWLLRWLGHDAVAVLDGGLRKWRTETRPMKSGAEGNETRTFIGTPRADMTVDVTSVSEMVDTPAWRLVDARSPERYRGEHEPIDKEAGHIPGAANHYYQSNVDEHGLFRTPEELRASLKPTIGETPADHVVCYCGSGVTACHNLLALEHAGIKGAKLYAGSWSEWSADPSRPVEKDKSA